jgi:hypothetical protein
MTGRIAILLFFLATLATPVSGGAAKPGTVPIPPGEAGAKASLESSPRHHEWVDIAVPGKEVKVSTFVAYPERKDKAPVVIVIQDDWIRAVADRLAADGFIAIAPDFLSGKGPGGGGTDKFASRDDVVKAVRGLAAPDVVAMLNGDAERREPLRKEPAGSEGQVRDHRILLGRRPELPLCHCAARPGCRGGLLRHLPGP